MTCWRRRRNHITASQRRSRCHVSLQFAERRQHRLVVLSARRGSCASDFFRRIHHWHF